MSSHTPQTNLSLERFRLDGMMLSCVFYGVYFVFTVQAWNALMQRPRYGGKIADHRYALLLYVFITFALATISFGLNAKYTEMIWIDLRDAPGGPSVLIENYMRYRINFTALVVGQLQQWFMQCLLLHRCFVIWDWSRRVVVPMIALYVIMIALSITVMVQASTGAKFYNIIIELAYLCVEVGLSVIYTVLVISRLFVMRWRMMQVIPQFDSSTYDTIALMVVESAGLYTIVSIVFIIGFGMYSIGLTTLCFLAIGKIQGIAQLFIIIRVAQGRAVTHEWSGRTAPVPTTMAFAGNVSHSTEGTRDEPIGKPEHTVVQLYADSDRATEIIVSAVSSPSMHVCV
ncbi:uncharacterized protein EDB93DRAFT_1256550 [Suillus bovinus]|uniref:uncharacterized protein n=1 Tax=Suillus bovinus TaxID=48563 RepID=UPI001B85EB57|nr:uncharacterized protein EDB93DRAFT_1256550 [Suillus bovinus]KAG2128759.1 hypothetical protein EDB93DRAFT_1256550 [Suillus bovinus]